LQPVGWILQYMKHVR